MKRSLIMLLAACLFLAACSSSPQATVPAPADAPAPESLVRVEGGQYRNISVAELQEMLKAKDFVFVNTHIPFEGNIAQTDVSIPFDQIDKHLDQLPADKNAKIVLYCRSDRMSNIAARTLTNLGYTNIYNLIGGFDAWKAAGLPLETQPK